MLGTTPSVKAPFLTWGLSCIFCKACAFPIHKEWYHCDSINSVCHLTSWSITGSIFLPWNFKLESNNWSFEHKDVMHSRSTACSLLSDHGYLLNQAVFYNRTFGSLLWSNLFWRMWCMCCQPPDAMRQICETCWGACTKQCILMHMHEQECDPALADMYIAVMPQNVSGWPLLKVLL